MHFKSFVMHYKTIWSIIVFFYVFKNRILCRGVLRQFLKWCSVYVCVWWDVFFFRGGGEGYQKIMEKHCLSPSSIALFIPYFPYPLLCSLKPSYILRSIVPSLSWRAPSSFICVLHLTSLFSKVEGLLGRVGPLQRRVVVLSHPAGQRHCSPSRHRLIWGNRLQRILVWMKRGADARSMMRHCLHVMERQHTPWSRCPRSHVRANNQVSKFLALSPISLCACQMIFISLSVFLKRTTQRTHHCCHSVRGTKKSRQMTVCLHVCEARVGARRQEQPGHQQTSGACPEEELALLRPQWQPVSLFHHHCWHGQKKQDRHYGKEGKRSRKQMNQDNDGIEKETTKCSTAWVSNSFPMMVVNNSPLIIADLGQQLSDSGKEISVLHVNGWARPPDHGFQWCCRCDSFSFPNRLQSKQSSIGDDPSEPAEEPSSVPERWVSQEAVALLLELWTVCGQVHHRLVSPLTESSANSGG